MQPPRGSSLASVCPNLPQGLLSNGATPGAIMRRIFVTKPVVAAQCLAMLIYTVRDGISATDKSRELRESCAAKPDAPKPGPPLTSRENEVMAWLAKGFLDKEIAGALTISIWTVHNHLKHIYEKLGVRTRTEAVLKYLQK